jgi:tetratricopeptide (TPR) repeat protein
MESILKPEEFSRVEELIYQAKFDKALELIEDFEKTVKKGSINQLWGLVLKGKIHCYKEQYKTAIEIGNLAHQLSQKLEHVVESVEALVIKAHVVYIGNIEESARLITDAEIGLKSFIDYSVSDYSRLQADIYLIKSIISRTKGDLNDAFRFAEQCLLIRQNLDNKIDLSSIYNQLGILYLYDSKSNLGLEYTTKSLTIQEELGNLVGITRSAYLVGMCYFTKGDFDQALKLGKQSLKNKEISVLTKVEALDLVASVYINKGQLDRAIKYRSRAAKIAQKENYNEQFLISTYGIGVIWLRVISRPVYSFQKNLIPDMALKLHYSI